MEDTKEKEFVDGWTISQTLGEGAFGEVKLLINLKGDSVAMKMIDLEKHPTACTSVKKEVAIQRNLQHPNILKFYGKRSQDNIEFLFLEYAAGGELFDRIEPDVGMQANEAQRYFVQLLSGVRYLHDKGITHRDLKPENLLLDIHDNIKISDFGMATMFRLKGRERQLTTKCGTLPYVAPEVLVKPYDAMPADIWSCGIILVTMLSGELPWDQPTLDCREFIAWIKNKYEEKSPWKKLSTSVTALLRNILSIEPVDRITLGELQKHKWCETKLHVIARDKAGNSKHEFTKDKLQSRRSNCDINLPDDGVTRMCLSQPSISHYTKLPENFHTKNVICFSQPTLVDDLILGTQLNVTQCPNLLQRLVKRMTRFFIKCTHLDETLKLLTTSLDKLGYNWKIQDDNTTVVIMTTDRRKTDLVYRANLIEMDGKILLDFRLSRGCGLDFKRGFLKIKGALDDVVCKGPIT